MLYEITLESPNGRVFTERCELKISPELTWQEFCEHREFRHMIKHREQWRVIDITPEDLLKDQDCDEQEQEQDLELDLEVAEPEPEIEDVEVEVEPEKPKSVFIDGWSGRTTKNIEFTRWMAEGEKNGIPALTFKSRVYKLGYDYQRAATQPRGRQGNKQKRKQNEN
jgi:hypothetical protein